MDKLAEGPLPKRWVQLRKVFEGDGWTLDRISGSHHIVIKPKRRFIPVAFHGGAINPRHVTQVLRKVGSFRGQTAANSIAETKKNDHAVVTKQSPRISSRNVESAKHGRSRKLGEEPKSLSKVQLDGAGRKEKQGQNLLDQFRCLELERLQNQRDRAEQRSTSLEIIHGPIATGEYGAAIASTSFIEQTIDFGSSSEDWSFKSDIVFYRTVALCEQALSSLSFNSKRQCEQLEGALSLAGRLLEAPPEHTKEHLEFVLALQSRTAATYLDGLS